MYRYYNGVSHRRSPLGDMLTTLSLRFHAARTLFDYYHQERSETLRALLGKSFAADCRKYGRVHKSWLERWAA